MDGRLENGRPGAKHIVKAAMAGFSGDGLIPLKTTTVETFKRERVKAKDDEKVEVKSDVEADDVSVGSGVKPGLKSSKVKTKTDESRGERGKRKRTQDSNDHPGDRSEDDNEGWGPPWQDRDWAPRPYYNTRYRSGWRPRYPNWRRYY